MMVGSSLQTVAVLLSLKNVSGHGYTTDPPTRAFLCKSKGVDSSIGCKDFAGPAIWEPHSNGNGNVKGDPQGVIPTNICGAGQPQFSGLSHFPASDWEATPIRPSATGKFHFKYHCTACHKTLSWQAYITKPHWNGETEELKWTDMKRFCNNVVGDEFDGPIPATLSEYDCPFPEATGNKRDIIVILWDRVRQDSGEMFISCIDVIIEGAIPKSKVAGPAPALRTAKPTTLTQAPSPTSAPKKSVSTPKKKEEKEEEEEEKEEEKDRNETLDQIIELAKSLKEE